MAGRHGFEKFELAGADYHFPMFYTAAVITFRPKFVEDAVPVLTSAVDRLIAHLPFLGGVVVPSDKDPRLMEVRPTTDDYSNPPLCNIKRLPHLRLPHSVVSSKQDRDGETYDRNATYILAPIQEAASCKHPPVLLFQINVLADGILFVTYNNHSVLDGAGVDAVTSMVASFARTYNEPNGPFDLPTDLKSQIDMRAFIANIASDQERNEENVTDTQFAKTEDHLDVENVSLIDYNFLLSIEKIQRLRQLVRLESEEKHVNSQSGTPNYPVSDDDIVTAVLWLCIGKFRASVEEDGSSTCVLQRMVNVRSRMSPPLSAYYLGNSFISLEHSHTRVQPSVTTGESEDVTEESFARQIAPLARSLRSKLNHTDDKYVRNTLRQLFPLIDRPPIVMPHVAITSIRRLCAWQRSFGPLLGNGVDYDLLPCNVPDGVCTLKTFGSRSWKVGVVLRKEEQAKLKNDPMFRWLTEEGAPLRLFESTAF